MPSIGSGTDIRTGGERDCHGRAAAQKLSCFLNIFRISKSGMWSKSLEKKAPLLLCSSSWTQPVRKRAPLECKFFILALKLAQSIYQAHPSLHKLEVFSFPSPLKLQEGPSQNWCEIAMTMTTLLFTTPPMKFIENTIAWVPLGPVRVTPNLPATILCLHGSSLGWT